jgi:formylglycine-generating enzyme required for sulfatase activity
MVRIAGGAFTMGSDLDRPALGLAHPPHAVTVTAFCLGAREVTVAEYAACSQGGGCTAAHRDAYFADASEQGGDSNDVALHGTLCNAGRPGRDRHPVNCISHTQAAAYCAAQGGRLPSEAEWEFAARGPESRAYPWGSARPTRAHANACGKECARWHAAMGLETEMHGLMFNADDGYAGTAPVGSFPLGTSPDGVEDLIGNVFEWTSGGLYNYSREAALDPRGPTDVDSFVIRGGNFNSGVREFADPALRFAMHRDSYSHGVGFRCAASLVEGPGNGLSGVSSGQLPIR